jgi:hypothetical protein
MTAQDIIFEVFLGAIAIPWCIWCTTSIFQIRQELAILKQIFELLKKKL